MVGVCLRRLGSMTGQPSPPPSRVRGELDTGLASTPSALPSIDAIRACFPALARPLAFLENAGGSQLPASVIDAMSDYMRSTYVQLGAGYPESEVATRTVDDAHGWVETLVHAGDAGRVILGASTSSLLRMLAECWRPLIRPGDEIVVAEAGHESNISPWLTLEQQGARIRWWRGDDGMNGCSLDALDAVLTERTRLVCFHHVSNLLGGVVDVPAVVRRAHAAGARAVVDGVAYAPHRSLDMTSWGCDWYVFSTYKVYGPHMAALFGRHEAIDALEGPGHFFIPRTKVPAKFELGGVSHEGCAGLLGLRPYLARLAGEADELQQHTQVDRLTVERAFSHAESLEAVLTRRLIEGLKTIDGLRMIGDTHAGPDRVPTISVRHATRSSASIAHAAHGRQVAIRNGHMYSHRLCSALGIDPEDGVVRVSAVHYNTVDEIDRAVAAIRAAVNANSRDNR